MDGGFRAEFRQDPAEACRAYGLDALAEELGPSARAIQTLEVRESRSSLAGVVMAIAVEGVGVAELEGLLGRGLHGHAHAAAVKALSAHGMHVPRGEVSRLAPGAISGRGAAHLVRGASAVAAGEAGPGGAPGAPTREVASSPGESAAGPGGPAGGEVARWPDTPSGAGGGTGRPVTAAVQPAGSGIAPGQGGAVASGVSAGAAAAVPGAGVQAVSEAAPGGMTAAPTALLESPRLQMPAAARALLVHGQADPRLVSVLSSAVAHHTLRVGVIESITDPVHAQAIEIMSVDGQPVGPGNVAARDLITEIAALDPAVRPSEIGTPWPIQSQGFFTDAAYQDRLHLGFVSQTEYEPPSAQAGADLAGGAGGGPVAATPAAAGLAHAVDQALATPAPPAAQAGESAATQSGNGARGGAASAAAKPSAGAAHELAAQAAPAAPTNPDFGSPRAHAAFEAAKGELGVPYLWGGTSPKTGFDCSGLMQWAYRKGGVDLPRVAEDQARVGTPVDMSHLREGDLVFFQDSTGYIHHVGMYVGNHRFLHAPHTGDVVRYSDLRETYWTQQFAGGRHVVPLSAPTNGASAGVRVAAPAGAGAAGVAPALRDAEAATAGAVRVAVAPEPPPQPRTAVFKALERQERSFHRHTVHFLAAVKPEPGSPLYGQVGTQTPGLSAAQAIQGAAVQPQAAGPGAAVDQQPSARAADDLPTPSGGSISVRSSLLTGGQEKFVARLAQLTGLNPRVVAAWALAEESGGAAQAREAAGNFNWLNIGYFDSGAGRIAFDRAFADPVSAAEQAARFLQGKWGGASSSIRAILNNVGATPEQQLAGIANSNWASSHYGGGANLRGTYDLLREMQVTRSSRTP
jgi:cell wall-associated NlpC family hydrolase